MATQRKKPTLLAQGKPRTLGGRPRPWRVRLYAPEPGGTKYQVMFRAPAGEGEPWKRVLRRASSEDEARKIFAQAEAALDTEQATPVGADVRASRTIRMLGEEYLSGQRSSAASSPGRWRGASPGSTPTSCPTIGDVPVTKWRVEHSRKVMEKGGKTLFPSAAARTSAASWPRCASSPGGWAGSTAASTRSTDLEIGRANVLHGATAQYVDPRLRPETRQVRRWPTRPTSSVARTAPTRC